MMFIQYVAGCSGLHSSCSMGLHTVGAVLAVHVLTVAASARFFAPVVAFSAVVPVAQIPSAGPRIARPDRSQARASRGCALPLLLSMSLAGAPKPGVVYWLGNVLYVALTNRPRGLALAASRGAAFAMPEASGFKPLEAEPTVDDVVQSCNFTARCLLFCRSFVCTRNQISQ